MKGDVLVIEASHRRVAGLLARDLAEAISARREPFVITIAGESGTGKSETAVALADELLRLQGVRSVVLGQDDYFMLPPRSNHARRQADRDWLGPDCEVRLDLLQANIDAARGGAASIEKPLVDYQADSIGVELVLLAGVRVVIVEGTYVSLLRHVDCRVFIARTHAETVEHRRKRNRGGEVADPFTEGILRLEHQIIAGHRQIADVVVTRDFDVVWAE